MGRWMWWDVMAQIWDMVGWNAVEWLWDGCGGIEGERFWMFRMGPVGRGGMDLGYGGMWWDECNGSWWDMVRKIWDMVRWRCKWDVIGWTWDTVR